MNLKKNLIYKLKGKNIFRGKTVIVTGHTGFKGSWLSYWLTMYGANVVGISDKILTKPSHFEAINLRKKVKNFFFDISDLNKLSIVFKKTKPDFIFHLAAQALVKKSYDNPILTWKSNTFGTLNILENLRKYKKKCVCVLVTSDKSYKNLEIKRGYREDDELGGKDPYSASKAGAELAIQSYLNSYFLNKKTKSIIAVARAGNVIGGGDWSDDRLIPDCIKNWSKNKIVKIRSPNSTRPWQHVLEAVSGYIILSNKLHQNSKLNGQAFNFGPNYKVDHSVEKVVKEIKKNWKKAKFKILKNNKKKFFESNLLKLNSSKARSILGWKTILSFEQNINFVSSWYKNFYINKKKAEKMTKKQILTYMELAKK